MSDGYLKEYNFYITLNVNLNSSEMRLNTIVLESTTVLSTIFGMF